MTGDYYKILGVNKAADSAAIKKAYHDQAKKHHPDKNKGNKASEEKFKMINEAYAVLKDATKKQNYDTFGTTDPAQPGFQRHSSKPAGFEHIFRDVGGFESFFNHFGGTQQRQQARNPDLMSEMRISLNDAFTGTTVPFEIQMPDGSTNNLCLTIPAGVETGHRFKMPGKGPQQNTGLPAGDLYITVHVNQHSVFKRLGADLYIEKTISMVDAALGKETEIQTIDGVAVKVMIPPGTQPKHRMRLKNKGMPHFSRALRGDLYIGMIITVPTNLSKRQIEILKEFQAEASAKASK